MDCENISIPYYVVYASDYIVFRGKMNDNEIIEVFDAISDICLFGETDFKTDNPIQKKFYDKLLSNLYKNMKKYMSSIENGKKGGRPRGSGKNENPEKTYGLLLGSENKNLTETEEKPMGEPKQNLDETKRKENKIKEENIIEEKKIDYLFDPRLDNFFTAYSEICVDLPKLRYERRSKTVREALAEYLEETSCDLEYFKEVCKKANELKQIFDVKLDFKSVIKNHISIYNEKFKKADAGQVISKLVFK